MAAADALRKALAAGDVEQCRRIWAETQAHLPQPSTDEAEAAMHLARTQLRNMPFRLRAYSHAWLRERELPSGLPDALRPKAERLYPKVVSAVGISIQSRSALMRPAVPLIRRAMEAAVLEAEADGKLEDSAHVKARMTEARGREMKKLFGKVFR